ncbi:ER membrane protein complex subunit 9 [Ambystoma mexicanum]|uniref:ER membrane protein complex subunit 9 n=1 Tax=Ambystoma mexicanum TaxID=8296 RepID=UPI0037E9B4A4
MSELEISTQAYMKMCLHAARYPHGAVNGVLLARRPQGGRAECLCITDCVPLFHNHLSLSLALEVALNQIDLWSLKHDLILAGYYQANSNLDDKNASNIALRIAGRLSEYFSDAILITLDNRRLSPDPPLPPVIILQHKEKRWVPKDKNLIMWQNWEETRRITRTLLECKAYRQLVDFDAHLDDIRCDWTNQRINREIGKLASVANGSA